ncbi:type I methionyl aminopeptidase [bacterium]|nr:MAG: type I methionyl aminopeptidase [bacterium]
MIHLKSETDLVGLRKSGKILSGILRQLQELVCSGRSTTELDQLAEELIKRDGALSAFKGYKGFPANICVSLNEEIVHGIPGPRKINEGDIISIDIGINYNGYFTDAAVTLGVGRIDANSKKLIATAKSSLLEGIKKARIDNHLSDISYAIQSYVEAKGLSVVRQFVGHGIGKELHEEPEIPNFGIAKQGPMLKKGMVLAIEPMVNMGTWESMILDNGWTAVTRDKLPSAHFEHTIAITDNGPEILTK